MRRDMTTRSIISEMRDKFEIGRQFEGSSLSNVGFLSSGEITDSLRVGRNWPEVRERLTILVTVETTTDEHCLRSQVGMGSESDCLFGQLDRILQISDSESGVKTGKSGGVAGGEAEDVAGLLVKEVQIDCCDSSAIFSVDENCTDSLFRKKWYILFLNITSHLQARFSYNFQ